MKYTRLKFACYTTNITMSVVGNISPLLFLTFRSLYGISYSLLGFLVLINFCTQLIIDLIFSFFSHKFNISLAVKATPALAVAGILIYSLYPFFFPDSVYIGLVIGTVVFSAAGGFCEVLISPVIAAIPSENPEREMSKLHSVYAWGVVGVVIFSTLFLLAFGQKSWQILSLVFTVIPLTSFILFSGCKIPEMNNTQSSTGAAEVFKNPGVWFCVMIIFFGGAAECTMAQWCSGYCEQALGLPKVWGDIFGTALFSVMLGLGRSLYAKVGKNISRVLLLGALGAFGCYLLSALCPSPIIGLFACALTGFCVSMLWPGSLIVASDRFPTGGVVIFALMAAGGDFGASVGPQLVGIITDASIKLPAVNALANSLALSPEQLGMKIGMLAGAVFPIAGATLLFPVFSAHKKQNSKF